MLACERQLEGAAEALAGQDAHRVLAVTGTWALWAAAERNGQVLGDEQRLAFEHVTSGQDLALVVGYAGTGKSSMLGVARAAWETAGHRVRGAALSGIAAEGLEAGSGIGSRTLASLEHGWKGGRDLLTARDVLVIDEAGLVGSRQMERVLSAAASAGAKVVLVGDPEQLQAIEAGAAFRALADRHGAVEITEVRRQREAWQREATRELATGRTGEALGRYEQAGMVQGADTREAACAALVEGWDAERQAAPEQSRVILACTRAEVAELNRLARERLRTGGELGAEHQVVTERGERAFAAGDRVMFLQNERGLGVKNGSLGTVEGIEAGGRLAVRLDGAGTDGSARRVGFDVRDYGHVDHGYAATIHKAQGVTVDRAHVLASRFMDRHAAYVALTRHRDGVSLHYGRDEFRDGAALARSLGRERLKDTSLDYDGPEAAAYAATVYAERRGLDPLRPESAIVLRPEPEASAAAEPARAPRPGRFSGLRLGVGQVAPAPVRVEAADPEEDALSRAVGRFARAWEDATRMERAGLPVLPHQQRALEDAAGAVDDEQPGFAREVALTLREKPALGAPAAGSAAGRAALIFKAEMDEVWRAEEARREAERRAALEPVWSRLTEECLEAWRRQEMASPATWGRELAPERVEQARAELRRGVEALPEAELKRAVARWGEADAQRQREAQRQAERPRSGPSMRM